MSYFFINNIKYNYDLEFYTKFRKLNWKSQISLLEYCNNLKFHIPHYCYHKNLSIAGNCRMCLVEVKNSPKPIVSCSMNARLCLKNGEIFTNSPLIKKARESILEFLLLNHPLDCPICDQGGECDLQDQSFFFGFSKKRFYNYKRIVTDKDIGPIVKTIMTRCIHCTRCVRFATEIAGVEDLGIFGRGLKSEIGTYVNKIFKSELSGNIIDLCPVGALTSKPYPFLNRNWEVKSSNNIDFSDGFATNIQIFFKNNQIIKILPKYEKNYNLNNWITDKTRFSFDGMFSPERITSNFIINGSKTISNKISWITLLKELIYNIYFLDHLTNHSVKINLIIILFNNNINLESLNFLKILAYKYNFIHLRTIESYFINNDLEYNYLTNIFNNKHKFSLSNLCLLLNINTRYEGSNLNLKLRQKYLKGNFKIFSLNSFLDLTYPISYLGTNIKIFNTLSEGNNFYCQIFTTSINPFIIYNSELLKRKDSTILAKFFKILQSNTTLISNNWNGINVLNVYINNVGLITLNNFKSITINDFIKSTGLYFLNINSNITLLKRLIELKLLNYLKTNIKNSKFFIEQKDNMDNNFIFEKLNKNYNIYKYYNLPNNVFFETTGTYINTKGIFKKTIKMLNTTKNNQSKENWQILRKFYTSLKNITFFNHFTKNSIISFNSKSFNCFKNFSNFNYYTNKILTTKNLNSKSSFNKYILNNYNNIKTKYYNTKLKLWLEDFFIGGKDSYTKYSLIMIKCSKIYRLNSKNFENCLFN